MRTWLLLLALLLALAGLPYGGTELGELHPVSLLLVEMDEKMITVQTDTRQYGRGETLPLALQNLEETTTGHIFLDTVTNLVLTEGTQALIREWKAFLRPGVRVCIAADDIDAKGAGEYLLSHAPQNRLERVGENTQLQTLRSVEGGYLLEE